MNNESIPTDLFAALDTVVMERGNNGYFKVSGAVPGWFVEFYPDINSNRTKLIPGEKFPVLDNFLIDAEDFWINNETGVLKSGLWSETDHLGKEFYLEATAVSLETRKVLLISLREFANYTEKQTLIQKARENNLNYYQLLKEVQKREVLVHCIVHDLAGQLTGIKYCFELLTLQNLTPKALEYLEMGRKQCNKQEILVREILDAFSAEVDSIEVFKLNSSAAPDVLVCAKEIVDILLPVFSQNKIKLQLNFNLDSSHKWQVVGEKSRLDRVFSNLIENAFRHSPPNSTVTVTLEEDGEFIIIAVEDEGSGVSANISQTLFQKFTQGKNNPGKSGLGLYFCRITIEHWGGTIGYSNRPEGGARFWFRLPKILSCENPS